MTTANDIQLCARQKKELSDKLYQKMAAAIDGISISTLRNAMTTEAVKAVKKVGPQLSVSIDTEGLNTALAKVLAKASPAAVKVGPKAKTVAKKKTAAKKAA
ncbi:MAG: hypothetical protein PVI43_00015 [Candidatus Bathyarchaeota archaeon]|jgi:hypothetical protein